MLISIFINIQQTVTPFYLSFREKKKRNPVFPFFLCKFCTVPCSYVNILLSKMKFLIAIVLYRIERKLTPLLKTNLSVSDYVFLIYKLFFCLCIYLNPTLFLFFGITAQSRRTLLLFKRRI